METILIPKQCNKQFECKQRKKNDFHFYTASVHKKSCKTMDFDLDDPLGDLLSEGSADSFFGTTTKKKINESKDTSAPKSKVADLFGIGDDKPKEKSESGSALNIEHPITVTNSNNNKPTPTFISNAQTDLPKKPSTPKLIHKSIENEFTKRPETAKPMKKEIKFDDSDDILAELGFDPKNPKQLSGSKKANILDDLLDFSKATRDVTKSAPTKFQSPQKLVIIDTELKRSETTATDNTIPNRYSPSLGRPRTTQRTNSGNSLNDPLGFFSTPIKDAAKKDEAEPTKLKTTKKPTTVDWLGLDIDKETALPILAPSVKLASEKTDLPISSKTENFNSATVNTMPTPDASIQIIQNQPLPNSTLSTSLFNPMNNMTQGLTLMNIASAENENALQALQQQDTQLRIVTQMKQQENILLDMHNKQKALMKQQENQFNELLRRQMNRQHNLEENIQRQQEQINSYMNVLMAQSSIGGSIIAKDTEKMVTNGSSTENDSGKLDKIELEAEVKRLELEKLRLEDILQSVRSSYEQELNLLESSHK